MSITKEQAQYIALDDQGAGRCGIGEAALGEFVGKENIDTTLPEKTNLSPTSLYQNIMRAGIRPPDSGRSDLHPLVTDLIKAQFGIEFLDKKIHLLQQADINTNTIVMVLSTDLNSVPEYVFKQAYDVLHAPIIDPFPNLENDLVPAARQIYFYALLLGYIVETRFEELGISRDKDGRVIPRNLKTFYPENWEKHYFPEVFGLVPPIFLPGGLGTVSAETSTIGQGPMEQMPRSFFDDEWGETPSILKPYSIMNQRF
ncbi:MAG: hypothetical protein IT416_02845 [Candidatus Pacebacteria bacterium]|nr:hypothetical protein [Candidatus Paceibacterota bacterium]